MGRERWMGQGDLFALAGLAGRLPEAAQDEVRPLIAALLLEALAARTPQVGALETTGREADDEQDRV